MKKSDLKQLIKEEIKNILNESHQPGEVVLYKGTRYIVVDEDESIITLKNPKTQKTIKVNYNQFKNQSIDLKETNSDRALYLRGIQSMINSNPNSTLDEFISSELSQINKERLEDLNDDEVRLLNIKIIRFLNSNKKPQSTSGGEFNPKSKGYMGATYTGD
jgi:DNA topoisomerase VI subunit B